MSDNYNSIVVVFVPKIFFHLYLILLSTLNNISTLEQFKEFSAKNSCILNIILSENEEFTAILGVVKT